MNSLANKRIIIGVTGGIAAYKSADLIRRFQDAGSDVRVVMTENAKSFITPLTLQALSGKPVHSELLDTEAEAAMGHIELARWADLIVIAPASADFLAKLNSGEGDNLLLTLCLAARCNVAVAPAMNQAMWAAKATQVNLDSLSARGVEIVGPAAGIQACGDVGLGRMLEPQDIVNTLSKLFDTGVMAGKTVMITAGPTREAIDPVRYISNHSSGKMGYALAQAMLDAGANVVLISGPTSIAPPERVRCILIESARDMLEQVEVNLDGVDVFIGAAAVADYRPIDVSNKKLKKVDGALNTIELKENPDILATVAASTSTLFTVGFAAETHNVLEYAKTKLARKQLDMIIANDVSNPNIGFNSDDNAAWLIQKDQSEKYFEQTSKDQLARSIVIEIANASNK